MTLPTLPDVTQPCALCPREAATGPVCWPCHHHLGDLLSDRPGSDWNPKRPDDAYSPPGIQWLLSHVGDGQRATRPVLGSRGPAGFRSTSPADDTVIALHDGRSQPDDHMPWLAGRRWLGLTIGELAAHPDVVIARQELRALQRALLGLLHDEHGPRWVGTCRMLVDANGAPMTAEYLADAREQAEPGKDYAPWVYVCSAPLWSRPTPPAGDDERPPLPSVRCPSCRHVYGGLALVRMGQVDAEDVAA